MTVKDGLSGRTTVLLSDERPVEFWRSLGCSRGTTTPALALLAPRIPNEPEKGFDFNVAAPPTGGAGGG